MIETTAEDKTLIELPRTLIQAIVDLHACFEQDVIAALQATLTVRKLQHFDGINEPGFGSRQMPPARKYAADFLGVRLTTWTLPEMFAEFVDLTEEVAPEALDLLSAKRANRRRYVSRTPDGIHPGRPDLSVMRTKSGWWISKNIGQVDLIRGLRALAQASGLEYGSDIRFLFAHK